MILIREGTNEDEKYYVYKFPYEDSYWDVAMWVSKLDDLGIIDPGIVILCDWQHEPGEGDQTTAMVSPINEDELTVNLANLDVDGISFIGILSDEQIYVNFDLKTYEVEVSMPDDEVLEADYIAGELYLN